MARASFQVKPWISQAGVELLTLNEGGEVAFSPHGCRLGVVPNRWGDVTIYDATPLSEKR